jgi:hypothetical protein
MGDSATQFEKSLSRREFTVKSAMALLSGVAITIVGCGDSASPAAPSATPTTPATPTAPTTPTTATGDVTGTVSANHGHTATITGGSLAAGNAINLDITGGANHPHTVQLSVDEVNQIANGQRVSKNSSTNSAHSHTVTFN